MAFYSQLVVFSTVLTVYTSLISWLDIVSLVMAVAAAVVWWLGVVRDHQKDDVKYLQGHVVMVGKDVQELEHICTHLQRFEQRLDGSHALVAGTSLCDDFQKLLAQLQQREQRICKRFCALSMNL